MASTTFACVDGRAQGSGESSRIVVTDRRSRAEEILRDLGAQPRLTVYLGYAPGGGKTHRLLTEARALAANGARVALGWVETKGRRDLEALAAGLQVVSPRLAVVGDSSFADFDLAAALALDAQVFVIDELAHTNLSGGQHTKRWEDALALKAAGRSVLGAFNIQHLESVAPTAEALIGFPVREIVPTSFLRSADQVVAVDASPEQIEARLRAGAIVRLEDVDRALQGPFKPQTLRALRALLLRTIDDIARVRGEAIDTSSAVVVIPKDVDASALVAHAARFADAMNLSVSVAPLDASALEGAERAARAVGARVTEALSHRGVGGVGGVGGVSGSGGIGGAGGIGTWLGEMRASLLAVPSGDLARRIVAGGAVRDVLVVDAAHAASVASSGPRSVGVYQSFGQTLADRQRIGYGKLTVYLGAAAGCGKTYAMLDRANQMADAGIDVVGALIETHGRADTARLAEGLEVLPRKRIVAAGVTYEEFDVEALLARRPAVALVDELAHSNGPGSRHAKRYEDVLTVIRSGISVITTLNIQHLEGLNDVVRRLTGVTVRETIADGVLEYADELVLIDASPQTLRDRLRAGKIYPAERVEAALSSFFQTENLLALRELAVREALRVRRPAARNASLDLLLGVAARERDAALIHRAARLADRLGVELDVLHVAKRGHARDAVVGTLESEAVAARARWSVVVAERPFEELTRRAAETNAVLVVEGARAKPGLIAGPSVARRLLDAGATELFVLAPIASSSSSSAEL